jgi:hypothetical protein
MPDKLIVCSKLPYGLIITNPFNPDHKVQIRGLNGAPAGQNGTRMQVPYMTTEVDKDLWDAWFTMHNHSTRPFGPLKSGALFVAATTDEVKQKSREREKEKTGLEGLNRDGDGRNITPRTDED